MQHSEATLISSYRKLLPPQGQRTVGSRLLEPMGWIHTAAAGTREACPGGTWGHWKSCGNCRTHSLRHREGVSLPSSAFQSSQSVSHWLDPTGYLVIQEPEKQHVKVSILPHRAEQGKNRSMANRPKTDTDSVRTFKKTRQLEFRNCARLFVCVISLSSYLVWIASFLYSYLTG